MRKTLGTIAAVVTAMSLIGVAWASDDVGAGAESDIQRDAAISSSITTADDDTHVTSNDGNSTSTSLDDDGTIESEVAGVTSDSVDGDDQESTSTTVDDDDRDDDSATSTTIEDDDDRDDDRDEAEGDESAGVTTDLGVHTYVVSGVGEVTIEVLSSGLRLLAVNAPDWTVDVEKVESDRIEIEFRRGEEEAEFEAELHSSGGLSIEIDGD